MYRLRRSVQSRQRFLGNQWDLSDRRRRRFPAFRLDPLHLLGRLVPVNLAYLSRRRILAALLGRHLPLGLPAPRLRLPLAGLLDPRHPSDLEVPADREALAVLQTPASR